MATIKQIIMIIIVIISILWLIFIIHILVVIEFVFAVHEDFPLKIHLTIFKNRFKFSVILIEDLIEDKTPHPWLHLMKKLVLNDNASIHFEMLCTKFLDASECWWGECPPFNHLTQLNKPQI